MIHCMIQAEPATPTCSKPSANVQPQQRPIVTLVRALQVVVLPRIAVEFEDGPVAPIPVAILFALVTLVTALQANGVPFLNAILTGQVAALSDPIYYQVAAPGTIAILAILGALLPIAYPVANLAAPHCATNRVITHISSSADVPSCRHVAVWSNGTHTPVATLSSLGPRALESRSPRRTSPRRPGTCAAAAHEVGHLVAARQVGAQLRVPFLIPAGLGIIGSFGAVTGIKGTLKNREELLKIAAAGPAAGAALSLALVVIGLGLSAARAGPLVEVLTERTRHPLPATPPKPLPPPPLPLRLQSIFSNTHIVPFGQCMRRLTSARPHGIYHFITLQARMCTGHVHAYSRAGMLLKPSHFCPCLHNRVPQSPMHGQVPTPTCATVAWPHRPTAHLK